MFKFDNAIEKIITEKEIVAPQLYTYPPRKSYIMGISEHNKMLESKNLEEDSINLYIHFPFVSIKCELCNLYAFECMDNILYDNYITAILSQLEQELKYHGKQLKSVHFGGGDPLTLGYIRLFSIYKKISELFIITEATEISIEGTPKSVLDAYETKELEKISTFINRLNIGMLPFKNNSDGLLPTYPVGTIYDSIKSANNLKFKNISADIMIGEYLPMNEIMDVVEKLTIDVIDTVSIFPLTIRNDSIIGQKNKIDLYVSESYYEWYDVVKLKLIKRGYKQENSYRFTNENGGCLQEDAHYNGEIILGIGCGARTYGKVIDSVISPTAIGIKGIHEYIKKVKNNLLDEMRKYSIPKINEEAMICDIILNQQEIRLDKWMYLGNKYEECILKLNRLCDYGILKKSYNRFTLTDIGYKYHDAISLLFYSHESLKYDEDLISQLSKLESSVEI